MRLQQHPRQDSGITKPPERDGSRNDQPRVEARRRLGTTGNERGPYGLIDRLDAVRPLR
jgi:hypothetical protein